MQQGLWLARGEVFSEKIPRRLSWKAGTHPRGDLAEMHGEREPLRCLPRRLAASAPAQVLQLDFECLGSGCGLPTFADLVGLL